MFIFNPCIVSLCFFDFSPFKILIYSFVICMIISRNVRGLNNVGKLKEIGSRLLELRPTITILIETRVKQVKARNILNSLTLFRSPLNCVFAHATSTHEFGAMRSDCLVQFSILYPVSEPLELRFRSCILHPQVWSHA